MSLVTLTRPIAFRLPVVCCKLIRPQALEIMKEFYLEVDEIAKYHADILYGVLIVDNFISKTLRVFRQAVKLTKLEKFKSNEKW